MSNYEVAASFRFILAVVVFAAIVFGGSWMLVSCAFEHDRKASIEKCRALGTDPDDMIYIKNEHYLCVTKDGRVVGRT